MKQLPTEWNLATLYRDDTDPQIEKDLDEVTKESERLAAKWRDRDDWLKDPKVLRQLLDEIDANLERLGDEGKPGYYVGLRLSQRQTDPKLRALSTKIDDIAKENSNRTRFLGLQLGKVSAEQQQIFLTAPELEPYHYYLTTLFEAARFFLSDPEERVMSLLGTSAYGKWVQMLSGFLAKEEREVITEKGTKNLQNLDELLGLLSSKNKEVRDSAATGVNDILAAYAELAENELNALLETKKADDLLRGHSRPDEARHLSDEIDTKVVDVLLETVNNNFAIAKRFYEFKAKLLGVKKLAYHERSVEIGELGGEYSYEQSVAIVDRALAKLDPDFQKIFQQFLDGQIDAYPQKDKSGGAFCTHNLKAFPTYILLNHNNKLRDVTTLAHEVGHGINNELVRARQKAMYFGTPLSTAEVASTFMEDFALDELLQEANDERRLAIMLMKLNDDVSSIFRQVAAYRFEQELHQSYRQAGYLSKEQIGELFQKHMASYMGEAVDQSPGSQNWWIYWSHFRRPFYVYSYASGLLISKSLQAAVKADKAHVLKVKEFLSAGLSDSPKNIFAKLDINIEDSAFWQRGIDQVEHLLKEAEALAKKLGKV